MAGILIDRSQTMHKKNIERIRKEKEERDSEIHDKNKRVKRNV